MRVRRQTITTVAELRSECQRRRNSLTARVLPLPLADLRHWSLSAEGVLEHETGRYFRVVGARVEDPADTQEVLEQPIIEQREVGVLCLFVTRFDGEFHGLVTFKFEPGTPDGIEVAPTVQATRSNYEAVHGGARVPAIDLALADGVRALADAVQREQESWFLGKVNRNRIIELDPEEATRVARTVPESRWAPISVLLEAALESRLLNMDLRSVLSMWSLEVVSPERDPGIGTVGSQPAIVSLDRLSQWQIGDTIEHRQRRFFTIVGCRVEGHGREIRSWDQPLLAPTGMGQCTLLVRSRARGAELLVTERARIGSIRGPSLEPRYQRGDIADYTTLSRRRSMLAESSDLIRCRTIHSAVHAEEGGRFRGALVTYQVGLLEDDADEPRAGERWITLSELEALNQRGDKLSVELRTGLTMLKGLITTGAVKP